jgi:hypothetical protein
MAMTHLETGAASDADGEASGPCIFVQECSNAMSQALILSVLKSRSLPP